MNSLNFDTYNNVTFQRDIYKHSYIRNTTYHHV
jgi:hypothetical protein